MHSITNDHHKANTLSNQLSSMTQTKPIANASIVYRKITSETDSNIFQSELIKQQTWSAKWNVPFLNVHIALCRDPTTRHLDG